MNAIVLEAFHPVNVKLSNSNNLRSSKTLSNKLFGRALDRAVKPAGIAE